MTADIRTLSRAFQIKPPIDEPFIEPVIDVPFHPPGLKFDGVQNGLDGKPALNLFKVLHGAAKGNTLAVPIGEDVIKHWRESEAKYERAKK